MSENPVGLKSIDHMEFTSESLSSPTAKLFDTFGFLKTHTNESDNADLYSQGQIKFVVKASKDENSQSSQYLKNHGEGVSKVSFLVENAEKSLATAVSRGAVEVHNVKTEETEAGLIRTTAIKGFGDVVNEFVERPSGVFRAGYESTGNTGNPLGTRVSRIDHFTNNVPYGEMEHWVNFYERVYDFKVTRYFDIKGVNTGLYSKVVQSHDNGIIIPINQPEVENGKSQIQEFLDRHNGAGVQHIAFMTPDIISTIGELQDRGINFLETPHTYYENLPKRGFKYTESEEILEKFSLLADGDDTGYLLQIFTDTYIGPLFFEYIQRKNHWGFGEGNFQALFDSIELDQKKRGYLE